MSERFGLIVSATLMPTLINGYLVVSMDLSKTNRVCKGTVPLVE
jgi:hypothetical protein